MRAIRTTSVRTQWALLVDPGGNSEAHVDDITLIIEEIAPGDRIPLHTHPINEVIVIHEETPEVTLGDDTQEVGPGTVVFIPAGTPHGTRNASTSPIRIHAMFPSERIGIQYLERNPAPGTENNVPQPAFTIDVRGACRSVRLRRMEAAGIEPAQDFKRRGRGRECSTTAGRHGATHGRLACMPRQSAQTLSVLSVLLADPSVPHYGLEISKKANLASGTIYPLLARLEAAGWLESDWESIDPVAEGRRPRRYYRLTGEGERAARDAITRTFDQLAPVVSPGSVPRPIPSTG